MESLMKKRMTPIIPKTAYTMATSHIDHDISDYECDHQKEFCSSKFCLLCTMGEADTSFKRPEISKLFKEMASGDNISEQHVLMLSGLWQIAMSQPNDPEFPSLGIFKCMANLIYKGIKDKNWLLHNQNICIPYYAAHIIGSYTMNKEEFAEIAVQSGVIPPLMDLLRGKMSWVEERVAVRALGHLASYESTFKELAEYEEEVVKLAMNLASTCLDLVYVEFVGVKDVNKRLKYHRTLMTRAIGIGGLEMENQKAEEWASQLQCWSLNLLNCFACKQRSLHPMTHDMEFLENLCDMWGGLVNSTSSPSGVGLIRILCYTKLGRKRIVESSRIIKALGNLSRSSDHWQYIGIDCLLLLLKDPSTRYNVVEIAASYLIDLTELGNLGHKSNVGDTIMEVLLMEHKHSFAKRLHLEVERRNKERLITCEEKLKETRVLARLIKQRGDHMLWLGEAEEAIKKYIEALDVCPLRYKKERMVIYSNRAASYLMMKDADSAIRDSTRALCLSKPANTHSKSLWRRSQAYDMKGMSRESLMDCVMLMNNIGCTKIPYHAARMLCKQMDATWLFAHSSKLTHHNIEEQPHDHCTVMKNNRRLVPGLSTIIEEPFYVKEGSRRKKKGNGRRRQSIVRQCE